MGFIELKKGDVFENIEISEYKEGGIGRIYFGYCKVRQIKTVIKTIRRDIWDRYNLASLWQGIKDGLISGSLTGQPISLGEYIYYTFFREARLVCQAQGHPNIIRGSRIWWTDEGQPFFECEFVSDSQDLSSLYERVSKGPEPGHLSCLEVVHIALSFCNGMIYISDEMLRSYNQLHPDNPALGFVHRDIKPSNILITHRNQIKIIDLGLAKYILQKTPTIYSSVPIVSGTLPYMSPEQKINYEAVMPSSDIYSFGLVMYELLGGDLYSDELKKLGHVPPEFHAIIEKCLKDRMNERYQNFRELKDALTELVRGIKEGMTGIGEGLRCERCGYVSGLEVAGRGTGAVKEVIIQYRDHKMVRVPAGPFLKGCSEENRREILKRFNRSDVRSLLEDEDPQQVKLGAFEIDIHPVTNEQYYRFVKETNYRRVPSHWKDWGFSDPPYPPEQAMFPVVNVSYQDAVEYCKWAGLRLPTGDEWEKAARGTDGRIYPWGNRYDSELCNSAESGHRSPVSVDEYPGGRSPYGCLQMVGNVFEWVDEPHPKSSHFRYLRGGCWAVSCELLGIPFLHYVALREDAVSAGGQEDIIGFRCARDAKEEEAKMTPTSAKDTGQCPLCGGRFIEFDISDIRIPGRDIRTWNGFFDID